MFATILFPIEPSQDSQQAIEVVVNVAQAYQSRLVLLSVMEADAPQPEVTQFLARVRDLFGTEGIQTESLQRVGRPAFVICDVAEEVGADLIIMGCRGMGLTDNGLEESVTMRAINLAPCPVLVVP